MFLRRLFGKPSNGDRIALDAIAAYERSQDELDVIRRLREALALGLKDVPLDRVYMALGAACGDVGFDAEAEEAYETALRHNARNSTALSNLGMILEAKGDVERARELYQRAIEVKPSNAFAHSNLGYLLLKEGMLPEARQFLRRAVELDPRLAVASAHLARCCAAMADFADAEAAFQRASACGYGQLEVLRRELTERKLAVPPVYFDAESFQRLAEHLLPSDPKILATLERAIREPRAVYADLVASGRTFFLTDHLISNALPWLLLCEELQTRGLAVRGASRPLEAWIDLLRSAMRQRGLPVPAQAITDLAQGLRESCEGENGETNDGDALEALFEEVTLDGTVVLLRMWESAKQAILCPLARRVWETIAYPRYEGPEGPGMVELLGVAEVEEGKGPLN